MTLSTVRPLPRLHGPGGDLAGGGDLGVGVHPTRKRRNVIEVFSQPRLGLAPEKNTSS